jgi:hypothetical protein
MTAPLKSFSHTPILAGGMTPMAGILLPQPATALPIRLVATHKASRRIAQTTRRRVRAD